MRKETSRRCSCQLFILIDRNAIYHDPPDSLAQRQTVGITGPVGNTIQIDQQKIRIVSIQNRAFISDSEPFCRQ